MLAYYSSHPPRKLSAYPANWLMLSGIMLSAWFVALFLGGPIGAIRSNAIPRRYTSWDGIGPLNSHKVCAPRKPPDKGGIWRSSQPPRPNFVLSDSVEVPYFHWGPGAVFAAEGEGAGKPRKRSSVFWLPKEWLCELIQSFGPV